MPRPRRPAMYNTPSIRSGGFGALQVEAVTNRPASIQRRHLAASQLRMREIEPDELSQSEWVRFLVMEARERERWITAFTTRRRESNASSSSSGSGSGGIATDNDREAGSGSGCKAEEAKLEAQEARAEESRALTGDMRRSPPPTHSSSTSYRPRSNNPISGSTPFVSLWARHLDEIERQESGAHTARQPMHMRRAADEEGGARNRGVEAAPPAYHSIIPPNEAPPAYDYGDDYEGIPAYEPRSDDELEVGSGDEGAGRRQRVRRWSEQYLGRF